MTDVTDAEHRGPGEPDPITGYQPHDIHAEIQVLGSIMRDPDLADDLADLLHPDDYYRRAHADLHRLLAGMHASGQHTGDPHLVQRAVIAAGHHGKIADGIYLADMWQAGFPAQARHYAQIIATNAAARRLIEVGVTAGQAGRAPGFDPAEAVDVVQRRLDEVTRAATANVPPLIGPLAEDALHRIDNPEAAEPGIPTGLPDLDEVYAGHAPGRITVIGARPGSGKTTVGLQFARYAAIELGLPALFVTLEMTRDEIADRVLAAEAQVELGRILRGGLTAYDRTCLAEAADRVKAAPLYIDDTPHVGLGHLRHRAKTLQRGGGLSLLVVDYLQLMQTGRADNRQQQVAELSRGLKLLAKELSIPVLLLSQLNRASAQRSDKKPALSDLRESGAVEQDADTVLLLHRDELYEPESQRPGQLDVIVAKNRHGTTREVPVGWQGEYARVVDITNVPLRRFSDQGWSQS